MKLDKKAFLAYATAHFEETGEILPGLARIEASDRLSLKFAEEEDTEEGGELETP